MKKILLVVLLVPMFFTSCDEFEDLGRQIGWIDSVGYRYEYITKEMGKCEGIAANSCANVDYKGLLLTKGVTPEVKQLIESDLERSVLSINGSKAGNLQDFIYDNLKSYDEFVLEFPKYKGAWEWRISQEVNYNSKRILGVTLLNYTFTGGERGNTQIVFKNYNANTGHPLHLDSIFNPGYDKVLRPLLKEGLKEAANLDASKTLRELGLKDIEGAVLTNNFRIGQEGLVFFYNTYYFGTADGPFEVIIPWSKLQPELTEKGRTLVM